MLGLLTSLLAIGTILLASYGLGRPIVRALGPDGVDELTAGTWSLAVGMIAAGLALAALGLVGALYAPLVVVLSLAAGLWGVGELGRGYLYGFEQARAKAMNAAWDEDPLPPWAPPARWLCRGMLLLAGAACVGSLVGALAPPTAGDALCYHLDLPKRFLAEHALCYPPYSDNATFPLLVEMWYLWGLALDGAVAAQLVHWTLGILLALAAVVLARPILGRAWAWIVGAVVVLVPGVNNQMTAPLNDLGLAVLTTLALAAWWRATVGMEGRRWFLLAGLAGGGALGTKYLALVFALAVAATWLYALYRHPGRRRLLLEGAAVVSVVAVSIGGLWY
ncbi:MAG: phospholipid carrier-dependent glycosyltransferase, partial [Planctomycetia bacterium]|nr:phospholipid carrier-dependent glycosyltransferase [Planctomycetia bacterium]